MTYVTECTCCVFIAAEQPAIYFLQQPPSDVIGHVGGSVSLNCSAVSRDGGVVEVTWLKDGLGLVDEDESGRRSVSDETGALVIAPVIGGSIETSSGTSSTPAGDSDEGVYVCLATHGSNSIVSTPATLRIACQ